MTTVQMAAQALEDDSALWATASSELGSAASSAACLTVSDWDWPIRGTLEVHYRDLQTKVGDLLAGGRDQTDRLADELITIKGRLLSTDEAQQALLDGQWEFE